MRGAAIWDWDQKDPTMNKFGKTLSALVCAFALSPAAPDALAQKFEGAGYSGRYAGHGGYLVPAPAPGVRIYTGGQHHAARPFARSRTQSGVTIYAGGGGSVVNIAQTPDHIPAMDVVVVTRGARGTEQTVDAVCISADGKDMPAARAQAATRIHPNMHGELFRCEDGFTLNAFAGASAADGHEVACDRDMSLWRDMNGGLTCQPKTAMRCWRKGAGRHFGCQSEASMRHMHGTGPVTIGGTTRADHHAVIVTRGMSISGGVGYTPY
jgi:hypothetical protein